MQRSVIEILLVEIVPMSVAGWYFGIFLRRLGNRWRIGRIRHAFARGFETLLAVSGAVLWARIFVGMLLDDPAAATRVTLAGLVPLLLFGCCLRSVACRLRIARRDGSLRSGNRILDLLLLVLMAALLWWAYREIGIAATAYFT